MEVNFDVLIILIALITFAVMICMLFSHENKLYVLEYNHCLYHPDTHIQHYRVKVRSEGFFKTKEETIFIAYGTEKQRISVKNSLEQSFNNKSPLKIQ